MFVNEVNDVKIYNLSAGKSMPEWLTDRRKRSKLMKKVDSRRQIELIQDFEMPGVCSSIRMSPDQEYILATGTYKPRVKCYEVSNLSIKFERCFDSEVKTFEIISDDYSKMVFLQSDRFIEIHSRSGRHFRLRIPRFGRDMKYHKPSCDLFIVGTSSDVFRLNLERGQFLQPFETESSCVNACDVNPEHHLLLVGTREGMVEAWDPRAKTRCATLDIAIKLPGTNNFPSVSAVKFKNGLNLGIGTASGHVLLYDIRSREPLLIKDHLNRVPVKRIAFNPNHQTVYSMDEAMLKLWDENSGKQVAYIEATSKFNDFCTIDNTGMFFMAQEDVKMLTYYIPAMGPAPRWCSFLDNITEEIESEVVENLYDDYQFVTQKELEELGLEHLIGSNLLKGYMHGYFMDFRLYNKAKAVVEPFAFERFRKEKIRQEIENERKPRLQIKSKLPKVNQELAIKIMEEQSTAKASSNKQRDVPNLLEDTRFKAMFENTDFTINKNAEEYKLLAPVLNRLEKSKVKELKKRIETAPVAELHAEEAQPPEESDDEDLFGLHKDSENDNEGDGDSEPESSDDENIKEYSKEMKRAYKDVKRQRQADFEVMDDNEESHVKNPSPIKSVNKNGKEFSLPTKKNNIKMIALDAVSDLNANRHEQALKRLSLQDRLRRNEQTNANMISVEQSGGNRQMKFEMQKPAAVRREMKKREFEQKKHREERKKLIRPINALKLKKVNFK